jgi:signal transduction histidine kinase
MRQPESGATATAEPWPFAASTTPAPASPETDGSAASRRLQTLAYELTVAEARERQRIAHLLHDEIGQLLAMAQFRLSELSHSAATDSAQATLLEELRLLLYQAAQATRAATFELHSPVLHQLGLQAALQSLAQRMQRVSKMRVHVRCELGDLALADAVLSVLLRTVRELALNAQKHAKAANLWIALSHDDSTLQINVKDDGTGFDTAAVAGRFSPEGGFGLVSAEAQMQAIGGLLHIDSSPGFGTSATITLHTTGSPALAAPPELPSPVQPAHL